MGTDAIIDAILKAEGGFVEHPADRGGPTNMGVTLDTLSSHRGYECTASDVEHMAEDEARLVYKARYIVGPGFDQITDDSLRALAVDCAVLHGPGRAIKWLQELVHVTVDGVMGDKTVAAVNGTNARWLGVRLSNLRIRFMGRLITDKPSQAVFAAGWMNRATALADEFA